MNIEKVVKESREYAIEKYERFKGYTNTDEGHVMVSFCQKTLNSRKVNDWGRDKDEDMYIGVDETGWIKYIHTIEHLTGPIKIKDPQVKRLSDDDVISYLESDECTQKEYLNFMSNAYKIIYY